MAFVGTRSFSCCGLVAALRFRQRVNRLQPRVLVAFQASAGNLSRLTLDENSALGPLQNQMQLNSG